MVHLSTQMLAFGDCLWSFYEVFYTSLTFFTGSHFHGIFDRSPTFVTVQIPGTEEGFQKTYVWTVLILTLLTGIIWVDASFQLLIGTRKVAQVTTEDVSRCRYWLHVSYALLFLFAFKSYSNTGYVSAFLISCLALLYRGVAIYVVHEKIGRMEHELFECQSAADSERRRSMYTTPGFP